MANGDQKNRAFAFRMGREEPDYVVVEGESGDTQSLGVRRKMGVGANAGVGVLGFLVVVPGDLDSEIAGHGWR
jgi:hypothetical protein